MGLGRIREMVYKHALPIETIYSMALMRSMVMSLHAWNRAAICAVEAL